MSLGRRLLALMVMVAAVAAAVPVLMRGPEDPFAPWVLVLSGLVFVTLWRICRYVEDRRLWKPKG